ncbi:MAG TPA: hypothetical protein DEO65_09350 [Bacillus bacterium]|uniref:Uncharacterized protein n=1 Tax=Siminovitchia fordii TaxID=254759 RepID=A0ABQ4K2I5_9BACI|nr:hypothetical protein [Siminovitchia fordii]GIN19337.1 hypothetical protein J1TS3_04710 [Siminovitchia fordii]HBZ10066.1 hypothetical protein [Bacillus sp. (in: firmicutes)]
MFLDSYVNQKVQIKFKNLPESLSGAVTGIYHPDKWCIAKLIYTESMGIWVENPCYERTKIKEDDGSDIPASEQFTESCPTHILIKWDYIDSVIVFPADEMLGAGKEAKLIGFHS